MQPVSIELAYLREWSVGQTLDSRGSQAWVSRLEDESKWLSLSAVWEFLWSGWILAIALPSFSQSNRWTNRVTQLWEIPTSYSAWRKMILLLHKTSCNPFATSSSQFLLRPVVLSLTKSSDVKPPIQNSQLSPQVCRIRFFSRNWIWSQLQTCASKCLEYLIAPADTPIHPN